MIDDDKVMVEFLANILEDNGDNVRFALDGQTGLDQIVTDIPDLVILDMNLPGMDGYCVAERLRRESATQKLPIIAVTALDSAADYDAAYRAGCSAFISKPVNADHLVEVVRGFNLMGGG
ncbi:response regulator [Magnetospirillum sp. LM-5]|uniref:response regulator n=1 Tax=Magnetospirillum sp. LM-5 TaxID=2681466 RepID=UPI0015712496|nr:response regulator [Magnetospirillum sp. LM-5]